MSGSQRQPCLCDIHHRIWFVLSVWLQHQRTEPTNKGIYYTQVQIM